MALYRCQSLPNVLCPCLHNTMLYSMVTAWQACGAGASTHNALLTAALRSFSAISCAFSALRACIVTYKVQTRARRAAPGRLAQTNLMLYDECKRAQLSKMLEPGMCHNKFCIIKIWMHLCLVPAQSPPPGHGCRLVLHTLQVSFGVDKMTD